MARSSALQTGPLEPAVTRVVAPRRRTTVGRATTHGGRPTDFTQWIFVFILALVGLTPLSLSGGWPSSLMSVAAEETAASPRTIQDSGEQGARSPASESGVRLATFDIDATPGVGMWMAYDPVRRVDELGLRCRGIVLLGAGDPIVLCAVDWIGIGNEGHDRFRAVLAAAAGTDPSRVAVHTLHQHDAPRFDASAEQLLIEAGVSDLGFYQSGLARDVLQRLSVAVQQSLTTAVPVESFGYGVAKVAEVASNRRLLGPDGKVRATRFTATRDAALRAEPEGVIDPELTSLVFYHQEQPVAVLSYYACHPQSYYRTGVPSPDFPGIARFMQSQDVPSALPVHFNGAGGNLGAGKYNDGSPSNRLVLAGRLAAGMRAAREQAQRLPLTPELIGWQVEPVHLPVAEHLDAAALRRNLPQWKPTDFFGSPDRLAFWLRAQSGQPIELSCLRVGPVRVLHMPGELFVEYQLAAKALRPDLTVAMAAYGDYAPGYIGTARAYAEGGYETEPRSSNVGPGAEAVLMAGIERLLSDEPVAPDYGAQLPRIAPLEPDRALDSFAVAAGFALQQTAAEPLVSSPVAMQWDENGDLYVCEMRGYSERRDERLSRITRLRDLDGDGVYDQSQVFVDELAWPTALFPYNGGWYVVDAPDVWYFQDTDGDGRADRREVVLTGLGTSNVQGLANSFRWGLDNRLHLACSSNGGRVYRPQDGPAAAVELRGSDLALDPRSGQWSLTPGAAQHGMAFDDWGRKFVCSNSDHLQQVLYEPRYMERQPRLVPGPVRLSIAADGPQAEVFRISPVEPWRILRTRLRVSGVVGGPIEGGGRAAGYFTGATGVNLYRGDAYPDEWRDSSGQQLVAVVGDVGGNLIHRKRLQRAGVTMVGRRMDAESEWVASRDIWFRPAQFENGPDGTVHVIDVYREVIEHPHSLPPEIKQHLDLDSGRDRGRLYRIVPSGFQQRPTPQLGNQSPLQWIETLGHANAWHRETAARLLYQHAATDHATTETLRRPLERLLAECPTAVGRLHALYALLGQGLLSVDSLLLAVRDSHPQVRRHAVRLSEGLWASRWSQPQTAAAGGAGPGADAAKHGELWAACLALADDPDPEVRYQLAFSLGEFWPGNMASEPGTGTPLGTGKGTPLGTGKGLGFEDEAVLAALWRIAQQGADDGWVQTAVLSSLGPQTGEFLSRTLAAAKGETLPAAWSVRLVDLVVAEGDAERMWQLLGRLRESESPLDPAWLPVVQPLWRAVGGQTGGGGTTTDPGRRSATATWLEQLQQAASEQASEALRGFTVEAVAGLPTKDQLAGLQAALERLAWVEPDWAIPVLLEGILPAQPVEVQLAAVQGLARIGEPRIVAAYLEHWPSFSPRLRAAVWETLFADPPSVAATFAAVRDGRLSAEELPLERLQAVASRGSDELRAEAAGLLAARQRQDLEPLIDRYRQELGTGGDRVRGQALFRDHCAGCHRLNDYGYELGPSLAGVRHKGADFVLVHVLDPNREVNPLYFNYLALMEDGRTTTGMVVDESATRLTLQRADGVRETLSRAEMQELRNTGRSLMPEGLEKSLAPAQMRDLLWYLMDSP